MEPNGKAAEFTAGLRDLADWIDANADHLADHDLTSKGTTVLLCRGTKEEFLKMAELLGSYEQKLGRYFNLIRRFGPHELHLFIDPPAVGSSTTRMRPTTEWQLDDDVAAALTPEKVA